MSETYQYSYCDQCSTFIFSFSFTWKAAEWSKDSHTMKWQLRKSTQVAAFSSNLAALFGAFDKLQFLAGLCRLRFSASQVDARSYSSVISHPGLKLDHAPPTRCFITPSFLNPWTKIIIDSVVVLLTEELRGKIDCSPLPGGGGASVRSDFSHSNNLLKQSVVHLSNNAGF